MATSGPGAPVRRNDPCPCGSGKKYKKCCLGEADPTPDPASAPEAGSAPADLQSPPLESRRKRCTVPLPS